MASAKLGVPVASLSVSKGVVSGGGKTVTYGELVGDKAFNTVIPTMSTAGNATTPVQAVAGSPGTKPVSSYTMVGRKGVTPRIDIPAKVTGTYVYVHNVRLPGMVHGRVVRPHGQGAYGDGTAPAISSVDEGSIKHIPGAQVVRFGNFLGVVAEKEYDAIQAAAQLKVTYADMPAIRPIGNLFKGMRDDDTAGKAPARIATNRGDFDTAFKNAAQTLNRSYRYHYTGHLPIGPSCCVADVTPNGARVFTNTQDAYGTRQNIKDALDLVYAAKGQTALPLNRIRLTYLEGSSVYGSAPYRDANQAAAVMSLITGKPVRLQFMRWDEHGWDNLGPILMADIRAGADFRQPRDLVRVIQRGRRAAAHDLRLQPPGGIRHAEPHLDRACRRIQHVADHGQRGRGGRLAVRDLRPGQRNGGQTLAPGLSAAAGRTGARPLPGHSRHAARDHRQALPGNRQSGAGAGVQGAPRATGFGRGRQHARTMG
mgnify:CR=1 FL=1